MFCACTTGSCAISALVWPFDRKWQSHVTGSGPGRKYVLRMPRFFPRVFFFLVVVTWLPDVTEGHFIPFGVPLGVRIRNRKLCNTRSSSKQCWLGVFSTTSASYNHRKPRVLYLAWLLERNIRVLYLAWLPELATHVLYLAWWLELALVICPFYFHIESRLCSTLLRVHLKISTCKMFFFIFLMFRKIKSINSMVDL
jgi:hypothetical protein